MNDSRWIVFECNGSLESFNRIVLMYQDQVYQLVLYLLGDEQDAEKATQETFLVAYSTLLKAYHNRSFQPCLLRIAKKVCFDQFRKKKHHSISTAQQSSPECKEIETFAWQQDRGEHSEGLTKGSDCLDIQQRTIMQLPVPIRTAVVVVDILQLDYATASFVLSIPTSIVKSRVARGRKQIQDLWTLDSVVKMPSRDQDRFSAMCSHTKGDL